MPLRCRIQGEDTAPAERITSPSVVMVWRLPSMIASRPVTRAPSHSSLSTSTSVTISRLSRYATGFRNARRAEQRTPRTWLT